MSPADKAEFIAQLQVDPMPPTLITDSGSGVHALYALAHPLPATPENIKFIEGLNWGLILKYGGDPACFNADKILRVPGTINIPTTAKLKKGRVLKIIKSGLDPNKPNQSRSEPLFAAVVAMVGRKVPDTIIKGILTDPGWGGIGVRFR